MIRHSRSGTRLVALAVLALLAPAAHAQEVPTLGAPTNDPVIKRIYQEGMQNSQVARLAQVLMDSIGPRLTGSPANRAANDWLVKTYASWGVTARNEKYGTWRDWTRGQSRVELTQPRVRTLEATQLAWSPATPAGGLTGEVVNLPVYGAVLDSAGFARWLGTIRGKFVLMSFPQPTCRPDASWQQWATPATFQSMQAERDTAMRDWRQRLVGMRVNARALASQLDAAGVAGVLTNTWSRGWGVDKIFSARTTRAPSFDVSCEDYSLLARLAQNNQHPVVHAVAESKLAPQESPVYNTIAEVRGSAKPDEYVMLSAHLDSWDGASGATDNGTGTIIMLEAMRILRAAYPQPARTILAGHWSGEEEGDIGSAAYAADHPEVLKGLQVLLNQDNGTGNIDRVVTVGFMDAPEHFAKWMSQMPEDVWRGVTLEFPGYAHNESTDSDAFACRDAPGFFLNSADWDYNDYTWHTNRDTYDKISFDVIRRNATLIAMLAYEASEDPSKLGRERRVPAIAEETGREIPAPRCGNPPRSYRESESRGR
ncbi:MAG TPA: M28 family peptidase [Gemmatimonadaceae bacterium]|nr:M28 family peptidase [Gemmatimonadaceae bacterium]